MGRENEQFALAVGTSCSGCRRKLHPKRPILRLALARSSVLVALTFLASCGTHRQTNPVRAMDRATAEEAVYAAVLDSLFVPRQNMHWLVEETTDALFPLQDLVPEFWDAFQSFPRLQRSTLKDLQRANRQLRMLSRLEPAVRIALVAPSALDSLPRGYSPPPPDSPITDPSKYWRAFQTRFPDAAGVITFSRVGFGSDGRQAVVYVRYGCGSLCGGAKIVLLEQQLGRWRVRAEADGAA